MTDIPCPVCGDSINLHHAQGCYKRREPDDRTPGDYCPCRQSAADIANHELDKLRRELQEDEREL